MDTIIMGYISGNLTRYGNLIYWISIAIFMWGCESHPIDSQKKTAKKVEQKKVTSKRTQLEGDSVDYYVEDYFPNGKLASTYYLKDNMPEGFNRNFYANGSIDFEGYWKNGKKEGYFTYYDSLGKIDKVIQFINFRDSSDAMPNQIIDLNRNGDTLYQSSLFYSIISQKDTITVGEELQVFLSLKGPHVNSYVCFCDYDEVFRALSQRPCHSLLMKDGNLRLSIKNYNIGENVMVGYFLNSANNVDFKNEGSVKGNYMKSYFAYRFFVTR